MNKTQVLTVLETSIDFIEFKKTYQDGLNGITKIPVSGKLYWNRGKTLTTDVTLFVSLFVYDGMDKSVKFESRVYTEIPIEASNNIIEFQREIVLEKNIPEIIDFVELRFSYVAKIHKENIGEVSLNETVFFKTEFPVNIISLFGDKDYE